VVAYVREGVTPAEVARDFPQVSVADVLEALTFAAQALREREIPPQH